MNKRVTAKERNLIKGAIRRVFSRSELRRRIVDLTVMEGYSDPTRKRVKTWCLCPVCKVPTPKSYMQVDHIDPIIPLNRSFEEMSLDEVVDRIWCEENNLQALCETCHDKKTKAENAERRKNRKAKK
jgi:5-methylcytosine-specific restriction endonuclease McrA